jgi:hypothetical protein
MYALLLQLFCETFCSAGFSYALFWIYFILKPSSAALKKNKLGFLWQAHFMVQCHSLSEDGEEYGCEPSAWVLD